MDFTFGTITTDDTPVERILQILDSIRKQNIPNYEFIIVGGTKTYEEYTDVVHIPFDETIKNAWITKKKNLITEKAKYENVVYFHDYYSFCDDWYEGFLKFGNDWDVAMNKVVDIKNRRFNDWISWDHPTIPRYELFDYNDPSLAAYSYIPGCFWVAKKYVMVDIPLDISRVWGEEEDILFSLNARRKYRYVMNQFSTVKHLKKYRGFIE